MNRDLSSADLTPMTEEEIYATYQLFYFPAELTLDIIDRLSQLVSRVERIYSDHRRIFPFKVGEPCS